MNIFYLDENPELCAIYHVDKHVIKMILESAQILSTVLNEIYGEQVAPYKSTHKNHPCTIWAGENINNYSYLYNLFCFLNKEYIYRYNKNNNHLSYDKIVDSEIFSLAKVSLKNNKLTKPSLAMPNEFKVEDPVISYRNYYNNAKRHLFSWKNREIPYWVIL